jgi:iron(III) transport system substrate-binding protein
MQHRFTKRAAILLVGLVTALAVFAGASVGSAAPTKTVPIPPNPLKPILKQVAGLKIKGGFPNDPYDQKLIQLAQQEGGVVNVYSSLSSFVTKPLLSTWAATVPQIKLNFYRGASEDVSARFENESAAHASNGADVVETNGTTMLIYQHDKDLLVPFRQSPWEKQIPKIDQFDDFVADRLEMFAVSWNKNLVPNPPTSFQQLTDPQWKGKLAMEPTDSDWFAALEQYFTTQATPKMTSAQFESMMKKIAANSQLISGHSNEASALAAGQVSIVVTGHAQSMEQLQKAGAPIAFGPPFITPVIQRPQGMGISYQSPHPAAALLFYDFMISPVGQKMLQQNGVLPANPYFFDTAFNPSPTLHVFKMDIRPIVSNWVAWNKKYQSIIQP